MHARKAIIDLNRPAQLRVDAILHYVKSRQVSSLMCKVMARHGWCGFTAGITVKRGAGKARNYLRTARRLRNKQAAGKGATQPAPAA